MKSVVIHAEGNVCVEERPIPTLQTENDVLVKVVSSGLCGSDIPRIFAKGAHYYPITLGHEFSGYVESYGAAVTDLQPGDAVACVPLLPCFQCPQCQREYFSLCKQYQFVGSRSEGGNAEYVVVKRANLFRLPDQMPIDDGAFIEPITVGLHAFHLAQGCEGKNVIIIGAGTIGLSTIMCARAAGAAQVIALEMSSARKAKALEVGASQVLDPSRCDALGEIRALTGGLGADVSFECIGNKHTAKLAIDAIRKAGKCVLVGIFEEPSEFNFFELVSTEKQLLGALAYNGEFADVIAFIADGRLDIAPLVTGRIGLEEIVERGFEELVNNKEHNVKIIVSPGG